ncbi:MAG TPA: SGNH/GDSL hydrolase family protein [Puia sp.]|nr:SGNH/GDSL hydrolase family protein [Puia sp.]
MKKTVFCVLFPLLLTAFSHRPATWVAIGDSITYLNDHPDETKNRLTKGYLTDVTERLPYLHYLNQGRNGWTIQRFAARIDSLDIPAGDVYTVFLGTNDWWHGVPLGSWNDYARGTGDSTIYGSFRVLINKLRSLNPAAPIILITPMPRADFVYINDYRNNAWGSYKAKQGQTLEQVADVVLTIAKHEHFRFVDLYHDRRLAIPRLVHFKRLKDPQTGAYRDYGYPAYTAIPFDPSAGEYPYPEAAVDMTYDGLHPSDKGCLEIAGRVARALKRSL